MHAPIFPPARTPEENQFLNNIFIRISVLP
jgi:hypothetical protein